ncbi:hypothetical protein LUX29_01085 [Aureimonas altamirensis]|uniref:hypothetical protein n=1 Tax=Aureimonas altamirensis TaxID=370622 RepID=UPI001E585EE5|nr:hypothetical protein [Aureimonas altamirensis]UHD45882.1 hypothetical protein LUX29_01085 [Aureimonas altamirensis]
MADLEQCNIRVPSYAKDTFLRIARQARDYEVKDQDKAWAFVAQLDRLLDLSMDPDVEAMFARRLDKLENQLQRLMQEKEKATQTREAPMTVGERSGRRLTVEGEAELRRLIGEGFTDTQIGRRLGIRAYAVGRKRRRILETNTAP